MTEVTWLRQPHRWARVTGDFLALQGATASRVCANVAVAAPLVMKEAG